jgi:gag-polypeptide of LTR copia-type
MPLQRRMLQPFLIYYYALIHQPLWVELLLTLLWELSHQYPNGNARLAWQRLKQKYAPVTAFAIPTVYKKYAAAKLRKGHDPDVYITYVQDLRMRMADMSQPVDDCTFMLHILSDLADDYEMVEFH